MKSTATIAGKLTPKQRSENARKAALIGAKKRRDGKSSHKAVEQTDDLDLEIGYDIALPPPAHHKSTKFYEFLEKMGEGSHVVIKDKKIFMALYSAAGSYGKKNNKAFAGRKLKDGYGIWRIK